jgi:murein hydrolase activator
MKRFLLLFFLHSYFICFAWAQSRIELERQRNSTLNEITETNEILTNLQANKQNSLEILELINRKLTLRNNLINNLSKDVTKVEMRIEEINEQVYLLNKDIQLIKLEYGRLIYLSYINRNRYNGLMFLLSAKNMNQAYLRLKYIRQYTEYRKQQVKAISNLSSDLNKQIGLLELQKKEKSNLLSNKELEVKNLKIEETAKFEIVKKLKSREKELNEKLRVKKRIAEKLKREIEKVIKAEMKAAVTKSSEPNYVVAPEDKLLSANFKENRGRLPWPTDRGIITGFFGERSHPEYRGVKIKNDGIDISTTSGSYVKAVFDGEVRHVFSVLGANTTILIRHGNFYSLYSNLIDVRVKTGDKVKTKQILGKIFTDDQSKSSVLHIELYENLIKLDPQVWLTKN